MQTDTSRAIVYTSAYLENNIRKLDANLAGRLILCIEGYMDSLDSEVAPHPEVKDGDLLHSVGKPLNAICTEMGMNMSLDGYVRLRRRIRKDFPVVGFGAYGNCMFEDSQALRNTIFNFITHGL